MHLGLPTTRGRQAETSPCRCCRTASSTMPGQRTASMLNEITQYTGKCSHSGVDRKVSCMTCNGICERLEHRHGKGPTGGGCASKVCQLAHSKQRHEDCKAVGDEEASWQQEGSLNEHKAYLYVHDSRRKLLIGLIQLHSSLASASCQGAQLTVTP